MGSKEIMPGLNLESLRKIVAVSLSVIALLGFLTGMLVVPASASSCKSITTENPASLTGNVDIHDRIGSANLFEPAATSSDNTPDKALDLANASCCSVYCPASFVCAGVAPAALPLILRQVISVLSDQVPDNLVGEGLKRPPRLILKDLRHA
jgi:hypothetical protein